MKAEHPKSRVSKADDKGDTSPGSCRADRNNGKFFREALCVSPTMQVLSAPETRLGVVFACLFNEKLDFFAF